MQVAAANGGKLGLKCNYLQLNSLRVLQRIGRGQERVPLSDSEALYEQSIVEVLSVQMPCGPKNECGT